MTKKTVNVEHLRFHDREEKDYLKQRKQYLKDFKDSQKDAIAGAFFHVSEEDDDIKTVARIFGTEAEIVKGFSDVISQLPFELKTTILIMSMSDKDLIKMAKKGK